jgi:hypothetical protein
VGAALRHEHFEQRASTGSRRVRLIALLIGMLILGMKKRRNFGPDLGGALPG